MKHVSRPLPFVLTALLLIGGCMGQRARERVLDPALAGTVDRVVEDSALSSGYDAAAVGQFVTDIKAGRHAEALAMWPAVYSWVLDGIERNVNLGPNVKPSLRERARQFDLALRKRVVRG